MRVTPDDEVYRVNTVWLGPQGLTLPWGARYKAYLLWLLLFIGILFFEAVTPLSVGLPPVWEFSISVLVTYTVMAFSDHDVPVSALLAAAYGEARRGLAAKPRTEVTLTLDARVSIRRPARPRESRTPAAVKVPAVRRPRAKKRRAARWGRPDPALVLFAVAIVLVAVQGVTHVG